MSRPLRPDHAEWDVSVSDSELDQLRALTRLFPAGERSRELLFHWIDHHRLGTWLGEAFYWSNQLGSDQLRALSPSEVDFLASLSARAQAAGTYPEWLPPLLW